MSQHLVSNPTGDHNDKIANAAKVLGRSEDRKKVFKAIYQGKKKIKTVDEIAIASGLSNKRVLEEAVKLSGAGIIGKLRQNKRTVYQKDDFYTHVKNKVLTLSNSKEKLNKFPTRINPAGQTQVLKISFPKKIVNVKELSADDIDNFAKVKKIPHAIPIGKQLAEKKLKSAVQKLMSEKGKFTDWGGEVNDLYTSRLYLQGKRKSAAFAFKGKATKGNLTPKKLGKNGDQIQRLFKSPTEIFLIQYQGRIDQSVIEQMRQFAIAKSATEGCKIYYGVINDHDTARLIKAYPKEFK
jgi:hypothetical protein